MIPLVGDVLFDGEFVFSDGCIGEKWFVILADVGDSTSNVYVSRATSQKQSPKIQTCHEDDFQPVYFLPAGKTFKLDTWIQFDQVLIFDFTRATDLKNRSWQKKQLSIPTMRKIILCAAKSIHIDGYTEQALLRQAEVFK